MQNILTDRKQLFHGNQEREKERKGELERKKLDFLALHTSILVHGNCKIGTIRQGSGISFHELLMQQFVCSSVRYCNVLYSRLNIFCTQQASTTVWQAKEAIAMCSAKFTNSIITNFQCWERTTLLIVAPLHF